MASFTHNVYGGTMRMQSNLVSPEHVSRPRKDLNERVIEGCDFTVKDEICNNLVELSSCPMLQDIPEAKNAAFVNHGIYDIQMFEQFLAYNSHRQTIRCPRTNVSLPRYKFERKGRLSTGEATTLVQQCAGHPITERQARSFLELLMSPRTLGDTVSASRFVRGARRLKSEMEDKVSDYENFVREKARRARSNVPESSRRASRETLSNGNRENYQTSRVTPTEVQVESRYRTGLHSRHSTPATVSPDHSVSHRSHLSHSTSNWSSGESSVLFPTTLFPDSSSAMSQQDFVHEHSRRQHQFRAVSPEQDMDLQMAIALQNSLSMQRRTSSLVVDSPPSRQMPTMVYIAASMRGSCFHSKSTCYGLRSAHGVKPISQDDSRVLSMRPCTLCQPSLELSTTHRSLSAAAPQQRVSSGGVYIAASRKGKCYHSHGTCSGLRSASRVTSVSLEHASDMLGMQPCRVCRPQPPVSREQQRPERPPQPCTTRTPLNSYSVQVSSRSSSTFASAEHSSSRTYWITRTGQCYHSSKSCSSLRRSKCVTPSTGKPAGKRPCSHCC